ncbi:MAG: hypothetical protein GF341_11880 [candidate division Zixibacteria bacterium]|nr:hypothetical protein [candidate division Zixibacteria bacterium]
MKRFGFWTVLMIVGVLMTDPTYAESPVTITGEVRGRFEADKKRFAEDAHTQTFTLLRTRVGVLGQVNENVSGFVQFQDSRMLGGGVTFTEDGQSGSLVNKANVDVHQAFVQLDELWAGGPGLKAGRFELNLGNQRVFGAVGWHNIGRSWEGVQSFLNRETFRADAFWLKRTELNDETANNDYDILGGNLVFRRMDAEVFAIYEHEYYTALSGPPFLLERMNLGFFIDRQFQRVRIVSNGVVQFGEYNTYYINAAVLRDILAYLLTAEVEIKLDARVKPKLSAGFDYASGDDTPSDNDRSTYNNLYYTGHKFRGHMDYFITSRPEGLLDLIARGSISPAPGWRLGLDAHYFRSAADYLTEAGEDTNAIGAEFDLHASTTRVAGANIAGGASVFFPSEDFAGADNEPGLWGYLMVTVQFGQDD